MSNSNIPRWSCAKGHTFDFPFTEMGQAYGVPTHCFEEDSTGEPCLDSSTLIPMNTAADLAQEMWRTN